MCMNDPRIDLLERAGIEGSDMSSALSVLDKLGGMEAASEVHESSLADHFGHDAVRAAIVLRRAAEVRSYPI